MKTIIFPCFEKNVWVWKNVRKMDSYLFHASQDTRRLVKGLRCCSCLYVFAKNMKSEKGGNLVVVLGQNGIDVSEDENGGDRVDGGEVDVLDEAGVVTPH